MNAERLNEQGKDECATNSSEEKEVFIEEEHDEITSVNQPVTSAQEGQKEIAPLVERPSTEETWNVRSVTPRRSTRVRRALKRFVD